MLPWLSSHGNTGSTAWLLKTVVKQSVIKEAGLGRFAAQNIPKGASLCKYPKVAVSEAVKDKSVLFGKDRLLCFENTEDIYRIMFAYFEQCDKRHSLDEIKEGLQHFLAAWKGELVLFNHSLCTNHAAELTEYDFENCNVNLQKDFCTLDALRDIKAGEELFIDYKKFDFPEFYEPFCRKWDMPPMPEVIAALDNLKMQ